MTEQTSLGELERPVKLNDALSNEFEDCTSCRIMGSAAFTGLGIYTYYSGRAQLRQRQAEILKSGSRFGLGARRLALLGTSAVLVGTGVYRLIA